MKFHSCLNYPLFSLLCLLALVTFSSCEKDPPQASIQFDFKMDGSELKLNDNYVLGAENATIKAQQAQFYVSNLRLQKSDGTELSIDGYHLISTTNNSIDLGEIDESDYDRILFDIGIDSATNHLDPTTYDLSNPLAPQNPSMHWAWTSGYKFLIFEGQYDSDDSGSIEDTDEPFVLHVGGDGYLKSASVIESFEAEKGDIYDLTIEVDFAPLFSSYSIHEFPETKTGMVNDRHTTIVNAIPTIFF